MAEGLYGLAFRGLSSPATITDVGFVCWPLRWFAVEAEAPAADTGRTYRGFMTNVGRLGVGFR